MVNNYFFNKLYNISFLSSQDLLSLAIVFCEAKIKLFTEYKQLMKNRLPVISNLLEKYIGQEQENLVLLQEHYKENWGKELSKIITKYPWKNLYNRLSKFVIKENNFEKTIARLLRIKNKSKEQYLIAAQHSSDIKLRNLFRKLAERSNQKYIELSETINSNDLNEFKKETLNEEKKYTLLTLIQPGLAGLMDGSVSTLGPIFAAAFATNNTRQTFLVGLSASIGAGISMGFTEAIHDDGKLSGRGSPLKRGLANGIMTTIGGMGHTLPYLIKDFQLATIIAIIAVFIELWVIVWIQNKYMEISFGRATIQVVLGGLLVFFTGVFIGLS